MIELRLFRIAAYVSLAICVTSVIAIVLHLGPREDKLKSRYLAVDGTIFLFIRTDRLGGGPSGGVAIPLHIVAPAAAVLPICWALLSRRLNRRVTPGLCLSCGYDLRGSPDRCPECGRAIERVEAPHPTQTALDEKRVILRNLKHNQN